MIIPVNGRLYFVVMNLDRLPEDPRRAGCNRDNGKINLGSDLPFPTSAVQQLSHSQSTDQTKDIE